VTDRVPAGVDEEVEVTKLRARIGQPYTPMQHNTVVTRDSIRHYVHGYGDDNPLYAGEDSPGSRRDDIRAPSTYFLTCGFPRSFGLRGFHGLFAGIDLKVSVPARPGMVISASTVMSALDEREGRYAGHAYIQRFQTTYTDQEGTTLATLESYAFRTSRTSGSTSKKYAAETRATYTPEEIADISAQYLQEAGSRRGSQPLFAEDLSAGDPIPKIIKGPLTVTDNIAWTIGFGPVYVMAHRRWYRFRNDHPNAATLDEYGVPDVPERVHWDSDLAQRIGIPAPYDYGPQRIAWIEHAVTDWMGDHGELRRIAVQLRAPNYVGDVTSICGNLTKVERDGDRGVVELALSAVDQRGRATATGVVELTLPFRRQVAVS